MRHPAYYASITGWYSRHMKSQLFNVNASLPCTTSFKIVDSIPLMDDTDVWQVSKLRFCGLYRPYLSPVWGALYCL